MTRAEAINILNEFVNHFNHLIVDNITIGLDKETAQDDINAFNMAIEALKQEPKTGHWIEGSDIDIMGKKVYWYTCSNCNEDRGQNTNYCPNCGARMFESQESEE